MSEQDTFWISLGEKFFGLLLLIISMVLLYFTITSIDVLGSFSAFFVFLSIVILALGIVLLIARPPE